MDMKERCLEKLKEWFGDLQNEIKTVDNFRNDLTKEIEQLSNDLASPDFNKDMIKYDVRNNFKNDENPEKSLRAKQYDDLVDLYYKSRTQGFGKEVKRRIMLGNYVLSSGYFDAFYNKAKRVQKVIRQEFLDAFKQCDVILAPTVPMTAFKSGEATSDPVETYLTDICTVPINIAGLPSVSVPCGFNKKGMPIGMQIIGDKFKEGKILNVAYKYEQACPENFKDTKWGVKL